MRLRMAAGFITDDHGPRVQMREQAMGQWITQIEEDERQPMETPTERSTRERRQEIRDHRHFLKQDGRFHGIVRTIRRLQDGPERREAMSKPMLPVPWKLMWPSGGRQRALQSVQESRRDCRVRLHAPPPPGGSLTISK
jgi:hypothetical protein